MLSHSLFAELTRMILLLVVTLMAVHQFPTLRDFIAANAVDAGCHQGHGAHDHSAQMHTQTHAMHSHHQHH